MSVVENMQDQLDNRRFLASIFVDLKKAFVMVDHNIITRKLENCGVRGNTKD